jgi:uncharacterized protein (TIGR02246 family)
MTDAMVSRVAAELEIRNAISRIAILADQGELDEYIELFTEDSVWDLAGAPKQGRVDIRAGAERRRQEGVTGPGTATRHVISNVAVSVDGPDTATADAYFVFLRETSTAPTILNMGVYHDRFVREDGTWRLAHRHISFG